MFDKVQRPDQNAYVRQQQENETKQKEQKTKLNPDFLKYTPNFGDSISETTQKKDSADSSKNGNTKDNASSSKTGLPEDVQSKMEQSFGTSFNDVNVHANDKSANDLGALAYTQGKDIHFAPGQYNPESKKGQELLGHELTHVVQQRERRVKSPSVGDMQPTVVRKSEKQLKKEEQQKDYSISRIGGAKTQMQFQLKHGKEQLSTKLSQKHFNNYVNGEVKQLKKNKSAVHQLRSKANAFERQLKRDNISFGSEDYIQRTKDFFPGFDPVSPLLKSDPNFNVNDDKSLENEADTMGKKAAEGNSVSINGKTNNAIQKQEQDPPNNLASTWDWNTPQNSVQESGVINIPNTYEVATTESGNIELTLIDNESIRTEHILTNNIEAIRSYILRQYNWNAIVKTMKYISDNVNEFTFTSPTNISGTTDDNQIIIPDDGILGVVKLQLENAISSNNGEITADNINNITNAADGKPGANFATIMGETSQNTLRDEAGNTSMQKEDGTTIDLPDFSSDSEVTLYDFIRDITLARNGLWSDEENIVNLTGLRRELEISEEEDHAVQWNDTMAASWIETDEEGNQVKHCKHYTATTEPGNRDSSRMLRPQTATVLLGLHSSRQPAGRTKNILAQNSDTSGNGLTFREDRGMNLHPGGMRGYNAAAGNNNLRGGMVVSSGALADMAGGNGATTEDQFFVQLRLSKLFYLLSKYGINRNKSAYNHLKDLRNNAILLQSQSTPLTNSQEVAITDYNSVESLLSNNEYNDARKNYLKNTLKFDTIRENDILDGESTTEPNVSTANLQDGSLEVSSNVGQSSEGCQVIYGGGNFYDFWWNSLNKAEQSGQRRWYYTLINITNPYNQIQSEEGELND